MSLLPNWFKLLRYQRARGKTGLTIPFLIGASRLSVPPPEMGEADAYAKLVDLVVSLQGDVLPKPHSIVIKKCDELYVPIAALYPPEHRQAKCESVEDNRHKATRLYLECPYFETRRRTIDSATNGLWGRLGQNLMAGEFSFRGGGYADFNQQDLDFIERAHAHKEPDYSRWKVRID